MQLGHFLVESLVTQQIMAKWTTRYVTAAGKGAVL